MKKETRLEVFEECSRELLLFKSFIIVFFNFKRYTKFKFRVPDLILVLFSLKNKNPIS